MGELRNGNVGVLLENGLFENLAGNKTFDWVSEKDLDAEKETAEVH